MLTKCHFIKVGTGDDSSTVRAFHREQRETTEDKPLLESASHKQAVCSVSHSFTLGTESLERPDVLMPRDRNRVIKENLYYDRDCTIFIIMNILNFMS